MSKRIILASIIAIVLTIPAMAGEFTVNFNTTNPNVTVTAYKPNNMTPDWNWEGTAQFTLTGTGSAVGSVTSSTDGSHWSWGTCPGQPTVYGGYTASGGDFQSTFSANSYMTALGYFGYGHWSTHSIDATGVTAGSMTVWGDALAVWGTGSHLGGFTEGGQEYVGEVESVTVTGSKMNSGAGNVQPPNPADWNPTKFEGAQFTATATGSSTVSFGGSTDAGTYPEGGETHDWAVLAKQGLGFDIATTGSTLVGSLTTTYSYTNTLEQPNWIIGDTSTPLTYPWSGVPGYLTNP